MRKKGICSRCKQYKPLETPNVPLCRPCHRIMSRRQTLEFFADRDTDGFMCCLGHYQRGYFLPVKEWYLEEAKKQSFSPSPYDDCPLQKDINIHEIHGKKHIKTLAYVRKHAKDFIVLCEACHNRVHGKSQPPPKKNKPVLKLPQRPTSCKYCGQSHRLIKSAGTRTLASGSKVKRFKCPVCGRYQ